MVENIYLFTLSLCYNEHHVTLTSLEHVTWAKMSTFNHFNQEPCAFSNSSTICTIRRLVCSRNAWRSRTWRSSFRHYARTRWLSSLPHRQGCMFPSGRFRGTRCNENITITQYCGIITKLLCIHVMATRCSGIPVCLHACQLLA